MLLPNKYIKSPSFENAFWPQKKTPSLRKVLWILITFLLVDIFILNFKVKADFSPLALDPKANSNPRLSSSTTLKTTHFLGKHSPARPETRPNILVIMSDDQDADSLKWMPNVNHFLIERGSRFIESYTASPQCCPARASFFTGRFTHNNKVISNPKEDQSYQSDPEPEGYPFMDLGDSFSVPLQNKGYRTIFLGKFLNGYGTYHNHTAIGGDDKHPEQDLPPGWDDWNAFTRIGYYNYTLSEQTDPQNPQLRQFKKYSCQEQDHSTHVLTELALKKIREQGGQTQGPLKKPFFMYLGFYGPHGAAPGRDYGKENCFPNHPFVRHAPMPGAHELWKFKDLDLPPKAAFNETDLSDKPPWIAKLPDMNWAGTIDRSSFTSGQRARWAYQRYVETLQDMDQEIGRLVQELRQQDLLDNTILVFTSDHGVMRGEHRIEGGKVVPYQEAIKTPLVIAGPGIQSGLDRAELVSNVDLAPTILDWSGKDPSTPNASVPASPRDGLSLTTLFARGPLKADLSRHQWRSHLLVEFLAPWNLPDIPNLPPYQLVLGEKYKVIRWLEIKDGQALIDQAKFIEIYNLHSDRDELVNLNGQEKNDGLPKPWDYELKALDVLRDCKGEGCHFLGNNHP